MDNRWNQGYCGYKHAPLLPITFNNLNHIVSYINLLHFIISITPARFALENTGDPLTRCVRVAVKQVLCVVWIMHLNLISCDSLTR